jgi:hypothetical protein
MYAQDEVLDNTKVALKNGGSKDLIRYFNDSVELSFDGEMASYSKTQAEFVVRDFFKKYPPADFRYTHHGSSKEGQKFAIGKYQVSGGSSFLVYMHIKQFKGKNLIHKLDFAKE